MRNASSRKRNGNGCGVNAAFRIGQELLLTSNTNGCVLFSHRFGHKRTRRSIRFESAARKDSQDYGHKMIPFTQNEPLTDAELDRLGDVLTNCKGGKAMNVETLDGFFAALIAGPEAVMPSEYYPEVFGGEISDTCEFSSLEDANEFLGLMMRHWNDIAGTLFRDEIYAPLLIDDKDGIPQGNDWARGFMRGIGMRNDGWAELINNEDYGGSLLPIMLLFHEHDQDPDMRPDPICPEKRGGIIAMMAGGLLGAYRFFRKSRNAFAGTSFAPKPRRNTSKIGRNDPCPCGSGKKFKRCCCGTTIN